MILRAAAITYFPNNITQTVYVVAALSVMCKFNL